MYVYTAVINNDRTIRRNVIQLEHNVTTGYGWDRTAAIRWAQSVPAVAFLRNSYYQCCSHCCCQCCCYHQSTRTARMLALVKSLGKGRALESASAWRCRPPRAFGGGSTRRGSSHCFARRRRQTQQRVLACRKAES